MEPCALPEPFFRVYLTEAQSLLAPQVLQFCLLALELFRGFPQDLDILVDKPVRDFPVLFGNPVKEGCLIPT